MKDKGLVKTFKHFSCPTDLTRYLIAVILPQSINWGLKDEFEECTRKHSNPVFSDWGNIYIDRCRDGNERFC